MTNTRVLTCVCHRLSKSQTALNTSYTIGRGGPFTLAAVRVGRERGSMDDGGEMRKRTDGRGDVYATEDVRTAVINKEYGHTKMRAVQISHLSFHARHLRVAIGDIGI